MPYSLSLSQSKPTQYNSLDSWLTTEIMGLVPQSEIHTYIQPRSSSSALNPLFTSGHCYL